MRQPPTMDTSLQDVRMGEQGWRSGDSCALRGIVYGRIWMAQPVIVVKDEPEETILLLLPGSTCAFPEGYVRWKRGDYSLGTRWEEAKSDQLALKEITWQTNRVLMFLEPHRYYAPFLFWEHTTNRFRCYYINFQLPFKRSHCGFDTLDLDLDILIDPDYRWSWKDETDYLQGIEQGGILEEWAKEIERSKPEAIRRIQRRSYPMDGSWLDWRPDPAWKAPDLPEQWWQVP